MCKNTMLALTQFRVEPLLSDTSIGGGGGGGTYIKGTPPYFKDTSIKGTHPLREHLY